MRTNVVFRDMYPRVGIYSVVGFLHFAVHMLSDTFFYFCTYYYCVQHSTDIFYLHYSQHYTLEVNIHS